jgi:hypothetical protein
MKEPSNKPQSDVEADEILIVGRPKLAEFLTKKGFPIARRTLEKIPEEKAPPVFRRWGGRCLFRPSDVLVWAHTRYDRQFPSPSVAPRIQEEDEVPPF